MSQQGCVGSGTSYRSKRRALGAWDREVTGQGGKKKGNGKAWACSGEEECQLYF